MMASPRRWGPSQKGGAKRYEVVQARKLLGRERYRTCHCVAVRMAGAPFVVQDSGAADLVRAPRDGQLRNSVAPLVGECAKTSNHVEATLETARGEQPVVDRR